MIVSAYAGHLQYKSVCWPCAQTARATHAGIVRNLLPVPSNQKTPLDSYSFPELRAYYAPTLCRGVSPEPVLKQQVLVLNGDSTTTVPEYLPGWDSLPEWFV